MPKVRLGYCTLRKNGLGEKDFGIFIKLAIVVTYALFRRSKSHYAGVTFRFLVRVELISRG